MKFLEPTRKPKVTYTNNSLEFGKSCEESSWNHCTSTPHRSETNGIVERAVRGVKEGTSTVLLQPGLGNESWADSTECYCHLRNIQDLWSDGKTPYERRFGIPCNGQVIPFGAMVENHPISAKDPSKWHQFCLKVLPGKFLGYALYAANRRHWRVGGDGRIRTPRQKAQEVLTPMKSDNFLIPSRGWNRQSLWRRSTCENIHLDKGSSRTRRGTRSSSRRLRRTPFSNTSSRWLNTRWCGS